MASPADRSGADSMILRGRTCSIQLDCPVIVGILNVTPDSFSDGGRYMAAGNALEQARKMADEGAGLIDIGGESTRPGAPAVALQEELDRVLPVIEAVQKELPVPLSVDTSKSVVASEAVSAGAEFVNDISGLTFDQEMATTVAESGAGLIVMHTRGRPDVMQDDTTYDDVVEEVVAGLMESVKVALNAGIPRDKIVIDPGIGFGKDVRGNLALLKRTRELVAQGLPVMLGTSRKSFIGKVLGKECPHDRLVGGLTTIAFGVAGGAKLFRVHDVAASRDAALMAQAICKGAEWQNK